MKTTRILSAGLLAACFATGAAFAAGPIPPGDGEFQKYSDVGEWTVWIDVERTIEAGGGESLARGRSGTLIAAWDDPRARRVEVAFDAADEGYWLITGNSLPCKWVGFQYGGSAGRYLLAAPS